MRTTFSFSPESKESIHFSSFEKLTRPIGRKLEHSSSDGKEREANSPQPLIDIFKWAAQDKIFEIEVAEQNIQRISIEHVIKISKN